MKYKLNRIVSLFLFTCLLFSMFTGTIAYADNNDTQAEDHVMFDISTAIIVTEDEDEYDFLDLLDIYHDMEMNPAGESSMTKKNIADIAIQELNAEDNIEFPLHSDSIKYNDWYYDGHVSNAYANGEYDEQYNWNVIFVSWVAEQAGLIGSNRWIKTANAGELFAHLIDRGATTLTRTELLTNHELYPAEVNDLIFLPTENDQEIGIVVGSDADTISYILGDSNCTVELEAVAINKLPAEATVVKWETGSDYMLPYMTYLRERLGLNEAAIAGILTNIYFESSFVPTCIGDAGTSFGLCQWHNNRWKKLYLFCKERGLDWQTDIGQLEFMAEELNGRYCETLNVLRECPNTVDGAYEATLVFCALFEQPFDTHNSARSRANACVDIFYPRLTGDYTPLHPAADFDDTEEVWE